MLCIGYGCTASRTGSVSADIELILAGELLTLDQAADVAECSDERIRKACELAAMTNRPMGVKWATRWLVGKRDCSTISKMAGSTVVAA
jgi:hypothetical protein